MHKIVPLLFAALLFLITPAHSTELNDALVAYYPFDGNGNDASGNGNNGSVYGATLTSDRFGRANSAYYFNGLDNYIGAPSPDLHTFDSFTLSFWMKFETQPNRTWAMYFNTGGGGMVSMLY